MKRFFLLALCVAGSFSMLSCSEDDPEQMLEPSGSVTMMVNEEEKIFTNVTVEEFVEPDGDIRLDITASQNGSPGEYIRFKTYKYQTGEGLTRRWFYSDNSNTFETQTVEGENYNVDAYIIVNDDEKLRGTFSGALYNANSDYVAEIEAGEFRYDYNLPIQPQQ